MSAARRRAPTRQLAAWVRFALDRADEADAIAMRAFRRDPTVSTKPDRTLVTQADETIEEHIRADIADAFPDHGVVGEERGVSDATAAVQWYLDPIDGTHNFVRGVPVWATLIALAQDGELQAAVISAPALASRWWASRGGGAWSVGPGDDPAAPRAIGTSAIKALDESHILTSSASAVVDSGHAPGLSGLLRSAWRERGFGDFWGYTLVAEGAAEAMIEVGLSAWDLAAPMLLVEEAGGVLTDLDGRRSFDSGTAVATNGHQHAAILAALASGEASAADDRRGALDRRRRSP